MSDVKNQAMMSQSNENTNEEEEQAQRLRVGRIMRDIAAKLIRIDASVEDLECYGDELKGFLNKIDHHGRNEREDLEERMQAMLESDADPFGSSDYDLYLGAASPMSLPMEIWPDGKIMRGKGVADLRFQGPPGRIHGGVISGLLDMIMTRAQSIHQGMGFTGTLTIKYLASTPIDTEFELEAWVERAERKKMFIKGNVIVDGEVTATAEGIWISMFGEYPVQGKL